MEIYRRTLMAAAGTALATGSATALVPTTIEEGDGWSSYRGNPGNGRAVPGSGSFDEPDTIAWEYDETGPLAVVDGTVYLRAGPEVHALDAADGTVKWTSEEIPAGGTPAVADETVYVGGEQLTALDATDGSIRWVREFESESDDGSIWVSSPTVVYGRVYVVVDGGTLEPLEDDGTIYALDPTDGSVDWKRETVEVGDGEDRETLTFNRDPVAVANESVYALAEDDGTVATIDAATGEIRQTGPSGILDGIRGPLTAAGNLVFCPFLGSEETVVYEPETGEWDYLGGWGGIAANDQYRLGVADYSLSVSKCGGLEDQDYPYPCKGQWSISDDFRVLLGGTHTIVGDTAVIHRNPESTTREGDAMLTGYDLEDGSEKWSMSLSEMDLYPSSIRAIADDTLYLTSGKLYALRPADAVDGEDGSESDDSDSDRSDRDEDADTDGEDEDGSESDGSEREDDDGEDDSESNDGSDGDENADTDGEDDDDAESESDETDSEGDDGADDEDAADTEDSDDTPGFTPIAGVTGGALTLEWLRRRTVGDGGGDRDNSGGDSVEPGQE